MTDNAAQRAPATDITTARHFTAQDFLARARKVVTEQVYVPYIDATVNVRALTAADVQRARADIVETKSGRNVPRQDRDFSAMIVYYATVNDDGSQFFSREMIEELNNGAIYAAIQPISRVALRLSGLDEEAEEAARKKHAEGATSA